MSIGSIDHVQLAMPRGEEAKARAFYGGVLGMREVAKPPVLAKRGGVWFEAGSAQIHLGVEDDFRPAKKAHVALNIAANGLRQQLANAGYPVIEGEIVHNRKRFFTEDCFGNRLEFIADRGLTG